MKHPTTTEAETVSDIHQRLLIIRKRTRTLMRREEHVADVRKAFAQVVDGHRGNLHALELRDSDPGEDPRDILATIRLLCHKIAALEESKKSEVEIAKAAVDQARELLHASIFSDQLDLFVEQANAEEDNDASEAEAMSVVRVNEAGELVVEPRVASPVSPKAQSARVPHDPETGEVTT